MRALVALMCKTRTPVEVASAKPYELFRSTIGKYERQSSKYRIFAQYARMPLMI